MPSSSEWREWRNHPVTRTVLDRIEERIREQGEILASEGRATGSVEQIGMQTVAILNRIEGLKFIQREMEFEDEGDTAG